MRPQLDPKLWGPSYWTILHTYADHYKPIHRNKTIAFILSIPTLLPCGSCQDHAIAFILQTITVDPDLKQTTLSARTLQRFFTDLHNSINFRLGKPLFQESSYPKYDLKQTIRAFWYVMDTLSYSYVDNPSPIFIKSITHFMDLIPYLLHSDQWTYNASLFLSNTDLNGAITSSASFRAFKDRFKGYMGYSVEVKS